MKRITVDDDLRKKLLDFNEDCELCDESGRVLAKVHRTENSAHKEEWIPLTPEISDQEIERRKAANEKTYTTEELVAKLRHK